MRALRGAVLVAVAAGLTGFAAPNAQAATGAAFDPGSIISDAVFFNSGAMTEAQIQSFLNSKVAQCVAGYTCLKDYRQSTPSRASDSQCHAYAGGGDQTSAAIIRNVGLACGINPQVLLVMLQKEQALVTSSSPSASRYKIAMGYGCPDTAPCDVQFYGFFNQVYKAAWQMKLYGNSPGSFGYRAGRLNSIQFHPNASCGSSQVFITNQATANLYIYTPYRPNSAALSNLYGTGDSCSSYGNRNFWVYFSDWFGSPTQPHSPLGEFESATFAPGGVQVSGWAIDPDTSRPVQLDVYVDGVRLSTVSADYYRDDLTARFPGSGAYHGFSELLPMSFATHEICLWAHNQGEGSVTQIGQCKQVAQDGTPVGALESAMGTNNGILVRGWVLDPDNLGAASIHVYVDGGFVAQYSANGRRDDIGAGFPNYGPNHGFDVAVPFAAGQHTVCIWALNSGSGAVGATGCRMVIVDGSPFGAAETLSNAPGGVKIGGWAIDPDTSAPIELHLYVDGTFARSISAGKPVSGLEGRFPNYGDNHGFAENIAVSSGHHVFCLWALNTGTGNVTRIGDCQSKTVGGAPVGQFTDAVTAVGGVRITGWLVDPDVTGASQLDVYSDGKFLSRVSAGSDSDASLAAFPDFGTKHGFDAVIPVGEGSHSMCLWALNVGAGEVQPIGGCRAVSGLSSPFGALETVSGAPDSIGLTGWGLDPDTTSPLTVHAYVDGRFTLAITANVARADLASQFPQYSGNRGFTAQIPATKGRHSLCVWAVNVGPGQVKQIGSCIPVDVGGSPFGEFDSASWDPTGLSITGWVIEPDSRAAASLDVYVDGTLVRRILAGADVARLAREYPAYGSGHGFSERVPMSPGVHSVCLWAHNQGIGEVRQIGACKSVAAGGSPIGAFDAATATVGGITVSGWVIDPDTDAPTQVHAYVDGVFVRTIRADGARPDVATTQPGYGPDHGFSSVVAALPGSHTVCLWAPNVGLGEVKPIDTCRTVLVPTT